MSPPRKSSTRKSRGRDEAGKSASSAPTSPSADQGVVPIQSVQRAIAMLNLFSPRRTSMTLAEMREGLHMNTPTAHRYAITLRQTGMLHYDPAARTYELGSRTILLGTIGLNGLALTRIANDYLAKLVKITNLTTTLAIWGGDAPVVIRVNNETEGLFSIAIRIGTRLPPLHSAAGKVFLAFSPEAAALYGFDGDGAKRGGRKRSRHTAGAAAQISAREREMLRDEIGSVRETQIGINVDTLPGFCSIAAPVMQAEELVAALILNGTAATLPASASSDAAVKLRRVALEFGEALGGKSSQSHL